jgi:hypothetical protein
VVLNLRGITLMIDSRLGLIVTARWRRVERCYQVGCATGLKALVCRYVAM